jgi:hypothetical protein
VAVLCTPARARAAASGVALALGGACVLAGAAGGGGSASLGALPTARRAAAGLRELRLPAGASGRVVWLADGRGSLPADDRAARAAATSAELARAVVVAGSPAAVALPVARTAALDRVLAWHDAIVVVREPDASGAVIERALTSLAALGRPVVAMAPPPRLAAALAVGGLRAPVEAVNAVAALALGEGGRGG